MGGGAGRRSCWVETRDATQGPAGHRVAPQSPQCPTLVTHAVCCEEEQEGSKAKESTKEGASWKGGRSKQDKLPSSSTPQLGDSKREGPHEVGLSQNVGIKICALKGTYV